MSACFLFLSFIHSHRHTLPSTYVPQTCLTSSILSSSSLQLLLWWCPSSPLLFNVAWWCHHQDQDALCSICRRGRPFILYYVALIGPDRAPPNCWVRGNEGPSPGQGRAEGGAFHRACRHSSFPNFLCCPIFCVWISFQVFQYSVFYG